MATQITVTTQSPVIPTSEGQEGITSSNNQSAVIAVNLPSAVSGIPAMALQMPGLATLPIAAFSHQQPAMVQNQPATLPVMTPQPFQPSSGGGGIIVLNVGNGSNLAATINQLVAGGLVQPQQQTHIPIAQASVPSPVVQAATTIATTCISNSPSAAVSPSLQNTVTQSSFMDATLNRVITSQQMVNQQSVALTQSNVMMNPGGQMQIPVPVQHPQQQQQPAAYMLVPIPQMPGSQNPQANPGSTLVNLGQQTQTQPVFMNFQNQLVGSYPTQPPLQNVPLHMASSGITFNQQQAASVAQRLIQTNLPSSPMLNFGPNVSQGLPKSSELRSYLTKNLGGEIGNNNSSQNVTNHTVSTITENPHHASMSNPMTPIQQAEQTQYSEMRSHMISSQGQPASISNSSPQFHTSVSSPGLAFLAQVSSLSANQPTTAPASAHNVSSTDAEMSLNNNTTVPVYYNRVQKPVTHEVNNNIMPILPSDEVKRNVSDIESPSSSMTVSSTTKIGDESISGGEDPNAQQQNTFILDIADQAYEIQEEIIAEEPSKKGIKRKKEVPNVNVVKEKKKKGPAPKLDGTEVCLTCGDRASGFHYNSLSCEGCKGFFRRSVIKGASYTCKMNGNCTMDLYMRRKCQKCRYEKCLSVGMRAESVLSEEQMKAKKLKKECDPTVSPIKSLSEDSNMTLTPQQRNLLELLKANERRFQWPTMEDMKKVTVWVEDDDSAHSRSLRFAHFTEICIIIVQLVVEFTKQLPGFLTVLREDQIVLLKACAIEVMLLRAAKQYNKHDGTINFLNGKLYDKTSFYRAGMQVEFVDPIFQFCNSMAQLDLDETEYAILVAINTFSTDRPHIKDTKKVENMQDPYVDLLRVYSKIRHPNDPLMFARILMKIVELRTLNNYHSEQMFALKVQDQKLPPLLAEIWDM